ncbi:MAG: 30S ribosomal protein S28e [Candidatus Aenigmarchaeota archaeon]|nr:30S ribosomal protein S28e [Candidatus Aenigmarchaeota archaeon]
MTIPAEVVQVSGKLGIKGVSRVRARVLDGHDKNKIITRNVSGPVKPGDILMIKETGMDSESAFR